MQTKTRLEEFLGRKGEDLLRFINSKIDNNLRKTATAQDVFNDLIRYAMEHPAEVEKRSDQDLFICFLWKAKLLVYDKVKEMKKHDPENVAQRLKISPKAEKLGPSPTYVLHRQDKQQALRYYLSMITSPEQKRAMELVRLEGLTLAEAGARMGKTVTAVEKLLERGFANLVNKVRRSGGWKYATTGETT